MGSLPGRDERGFALLLVVLAVVVLSGTLLDRALHARVEYRHAANAGADVRARAAAHAGVAHVRARLEEAVLGAAGATPDPGLAELALRDGWARGPERVPLGAGATYAVRVGDLASLLSVNHAGREELERLFLAAGAGFRQAEVAARSIVDRREGGTLARPRSAGRAFESMEELRRLRGVEEIYPRVAAYLTPFGNGRVNLNTAPEPVLRSVPGLGDESIGTILSRRRSGDPLRSFLELEGALSAPARALLHAEMEAFVSRVSFRSEVVEVVSTGTVAGAPFGRTVRALLARSGPTVQVVRSFDE